MKRFFLHGNRARVNPKKPKRLMGAYYTSVITCNKTLPDGSVVNVSEENAEFARNDADRIRLS